MIDCKGDENTRQMMIMIMVIIMILIIISNHGDDDGDHSNIDRLSFIDAIGGGDWWLSATQGLLIILIPTSGYYP